MVEDQGFVFDEGVVVGSGPRGAERVSTAAVPPCPISPRSLPDGTASIAPSAATLAPDWSGGGTGQTEITKLLSGVVLGTRTSHLRCPIKGELTLSFCHKGEPVS